MDTQPERFALHGSRTLRFFAEIEFAVGTIEVPGIISPLTHAIAGMDSKGHQTNSSIFAYTWKQLAAA